MGIFSILWYVFLTIVSEDILSDSIAALGLMIAFYYGLTGYACASITAVICSRASRTSC